MSIRKMALLQRIGDYVAALKRHGHNVNAREVESTRDAVHMAIDVYENEVVRLTQLKQTVVEKVVVKKEKTHVEKCIDEVGEHTLVPTGLSELRRAKLPVRQRQVMLAIATGLSNSEIAAKLFLSDQTTSTHRTRVMEAFGFKNNAEIIFFCIKHNLIENPIK